MSEELGAAGLRFERDGVVAWCIIDRPQARNAFTPAMYFGIKRAVRIVNAGSGPGGADHHGHRGRLRPRR